MQITVNNQIPSDLKCIIKDTLNKPLDICQIISNLLINPVLTPLNKNHPVSVYIDNQQIDANDIIDLWIAIGQETVDINSEDILKNLYSKLLINYTRASDLSMNRIFAMQSGNISKMPEPSATVIYSPSVDVIPTARKFLAGQTGYDEWFACLAYYANPKTLGFYFANETCFDDFKSYFANEVAMITGILPAQTMQLCNDFQTSTLNSLTESFLLRNNDSDNNDAFSFARLLVNILMQYQNQVSNAEYGVLPFDVSELICPKSIVFVNIDKHAKATSRQVADEWKLINNSISTKPPMISINKLTQLTSMQRNMAKISGLAANALSNKFNSVQKAKSVAFSKTEPTMINITRIVKKIMDKMAFVNKSMNVYKKVKPSFARPNRREPDNFNKQGKLVSTKYKPDIHLYIDTSGSINERNYQDAVKACIIMAKKLNVNLYFNSFSHVLSQCVKLNTKDKSVAAIYREFQKIPKVTGGTNYSNVWNYIMRNKDRKREISILMTDFEYHAPNTHIEHPKNLYYIPVSHMYWNDIVRAAESFTKSIVSQVPDIRTHILF